MREHYTLVIRPRGLCDTSRSSGGSVAAEVLLKLAVITGDDGYVTKAATPLRALHQLMSRAPGGVGHWLAALDFYISSPKEVAIIGPKEDAATQQLLDTVFQRYLPNKVVVGAESTQTAIDQVGNLSVNSMPLLEGREMIGGKPTAFVCQNYACQLPVTDPEALAEQLEQ